MKHKIILLALALCSQPAFAFKCNTVMGGCPVDTTAGTSPHMRSDTGAKVTHTEKTAATPAKNGSAGSTGSNAKLPTKK